LIFDKIAIGHNYNFWLRCRFFANNSILYQFDFLAKIFIFYVVTFRPIYFVIVSASGIRCSIVSLSAEVFIWRKLAERTSGDYFVPLDAHSIVEKLELLSRPPKDMTNKQAVLVRMGFPVKEATERYLCPQCKNRVKCKFHFYF